MTFEAALLLNNQAVGMMKISCYGQAFDTLRDAVHLMRTSQEVTPRDAELVRQKLSEAAHRTSNPAVFPAPVDLEIISHDAADYIWQRNSAASALPLVRFETTDVDLYTDNEVGSAILLLNLGIASLCSGRENCATRFLSFSLRILESLFQRSQENPFILKRVIFISTICLNALIPTQLSHRQTENAEQSAQSLKLLADWAGSLKNSGLFSKDLEGCAAAA
jgi:hypothetical protein